MKLWTDGQQIISLQFLGRVNKPHPKAFNISAEERTRVWLHGENVICSAHLLNLVLNGYLHLSDLPVALMSRLSQMMERRKVVKGNRDEKEWKKRKNIMKKTGMRNEGVGEKKLYKETTE